MIKLNKTLVDPQIHGAIPFTIGKLRKHPLLNNIQHNSNDNDRNNFKTSKSIEDIYVNECLNNEEIDDCDNQESLNARLFEFVYKSSGTSFIERHLDDLGWEKKSEIKEYLPVACKQSLPFGKDEMLM